MPMRRRTELMFQLAIFSIGEVSAVFGPQIQRGPIAFSDRASMLRLEGTLIRRQGIRQSRRAGSVSGGDDAIQGDERRLTLHIRHSGEKIKDSLVKFLALLCLNSIRVGGAA